MDRDERYEVNSNGELVVGIPQTLGSNERKEMIANLFSINGWSYNLLKEYSSSHYHIRLNNRNLNCSKEFHLFHGNVRKEDPERNRKEKKIQLGSNNDPRDFFDNALILGFYVFDYKESLNESVIVAWPVEKEKNYPANPSLRVNMETDILTAKNMGYYVDNITGKRIVAFRPEFIYHYIEEYKSLHYSKEKIIKEMYDSKDEINLEDKIGTNKLFYGIPGCGKSWHIENEELGNVDKEHNVFRTTFYLDYSNSDFIGQIYPKVDDNGNVTYERVPGPFTKALERALSTNEMVYLVIEEINRGNAAAIFGDVFQLLDRLSENKDGRVPGDSEYPVSNEFIESYLKKKGISFVADKIFIPHNLTLFATMNTSDQNVFPLDTAFKRRWNMEKIITEWDKVDVRKDMFVPFSNITWEEFARSINKRMLEKNNNDDIFISEDKQMGPYFVKKEMLSLEENDCDINKLKSFVSNVMDYLYNDVTKFDHKILFNKDIYSYDKLYDIILNYKDSSNKNLFNNIFNFSIEGSLDKLDNEEDENNEGY